MITVFILYVLFCFHKYYRYVGNVHNRHEGAFGVFLRQFGNHLTRIKFSASTLDSG